jgi:Flp pilus assembly protein TadG
MRVPSPLIRRKVLVHRKPRSGTAAVEFALVVFPFLFMVFAILQLGLVFVIDSVLENATLETSRLIRTGEAVNRNLSAASFKTELCSRMSVFSSECASRAYVDVRELPQFRNQTLTSPIVNGSVSQGTMTYTNGAASRLMLVRVWYRQPVIAPTMFQALSRLSSGDMLLSVTTAFRTEPYT